MFKTLFGNLKSRVRKADPVDPAAFGDPVALETDWVPLVGGGANFQTHRLVKTQPNELRMKPTIGTFLFGGLFVLLGVGLSIAFTIGFYNESDPSKRYGLLIPVAVGLLFAGIGGYLLKTMGSGMIFDKTRGTLMKGGKPVCIESGEGVREKEVQLSSVHALQILKELCSGDKSTYWSYELNLVFHDGERVNVMDHGSYPKVKEDSELLGRFLGVPVWDGVKQQQEQG